MTDTIVLSRKEHNVSRRNIDPDALKVLYRLSSAGYKAYLVGGGVRDLLLGREPKDFDVATDAHPNEIKRLFRNCILVGRRFRLAHIRYSDKIIETSTFRRDPGEGSDEVLVDESGPLPHGDNTFGTPEEDARRRDFTVNGLFYSIDDFSVVDHVGGLRDLRKRTIRSIGDANVRFKEDPVRMLRAVRFASRLGFRLATRTRRALRRHRELILQAAPSRLLEEVLRLFAFGAGEGAFRLMRETRLLEPLFPEVAEYIRATGKGRSPLWHYLGGLDAEGGLEGEPSAALIMGALLCGPFRARLRDLGVAEDDGHRYGAAAEEVVAPVARRFQMPRRIQWALVHLMALQGRLESAHQRRGRQRFAGHELFAEALALYGLYVVAERADPAPLAFWRAAYAEAKGQRTHIGEWARRPADARSHERPAAALPEDERGEPDEGPGDERRREPESGTGAVGGGAGLPGDGPRRRRRRRPRGRRRGGAGDDGPQVPGGGDDAVGGPAQGRAAGSDGDAG